MRDYPYCLHCGAPIPDESRVDRRYCDKTCQNRHYKHVRSGKALAQQPIDYASRLAQMTPQRLGWVAGIIEGEGSISINARKKYNGNTYIYPLICVAMADEDVVRRLQDWTTLGRVTGPHLPPCRAIAGHKPQWQWNVNGLQAAQALMDALWPLLGERRREQVTVARKRLAERTLIRGCRLDNESP